MRTIILCLLLLPIISTAQQTETFIKLLDAGGQQIKGDALVKGYERCITALSFTSSGKNNAQLTFNMNVTGASADLKRAMSSGAPLLNGVVTVTQQGPRGPIILYSIKMEKIKVNNCAEMMGCNGQTNTSTTLSAARIGWTYYETDKNGKLVVSRKYGFDNETGKEWTNF